MTAMNTNTATVTSTGVDGSSELKRRGIIQNGGTSETVSAADKEATEQLRRALTKKYRHVAAVHSQTRPSTLSHDSTAAPSFLGFRNLMVIVLGRSFVEANL